jgi:hypothetical protein
MGVSGSVYCITNAVNDKQYVGCTAVAVERRWRKHLSKARNGSGFLLHAAIRKYGASAFGVDVLEVVEGERADLIAAEIRHIGERQSVAPRGYNMTSGGDGVDFTVEATRAKHGAAVRDLYADQDWRARRTAALAQAMADPEMRARHVEGVHRHLARPGAKEAVTAVLRKVMDTEAWREAQRAGARRRSEDPAWREATTARLRAPEMEAKRAAGARRMAADPDWQRRHAEMIARRSENVQWKLAQTEVRQAAAAARLAKALRFDAQCTPEERERRQRRREISRRHRERRAAEGSAP